MEGLSVPRPVPVLAHRGGIFYAFNRVEFDPFNMVEIDQFTFSCVLPRGYASRGHVLFAAGKGPFVRPLY